MGVSECDNMLMLLGVSQKLTRKQRDVVTPLIIQGFSGKRKTLAINTLLRGPLIQICVRRLVPAVMEDSQSLILGLSLGELHLQFARRQMLSCM